jgi:multiple sugar transport system substrate-binding protein
MPAPSFVTAMGGLGNSDLFINGKVVMYHSGLWQVPSFRQIKGFDWDVVEFPKGPKGRRALVMEGWAFGMVKGSAHPDLAYELVKYLTGEKGQQYMAATGSAQPALMKVASSKYFLDGQTPKSKGFLLKAVKDGHFEPFDPQIVEWRSLILTNLDRVWSGTETAEQVLTRSTQEVNTKFFGKK